MDGSHHAVRPKYLAQYLVEFQCRFNRRYDPAALAERLLRAAAATLPLPLLWDHLEDTGGPRVSPAGPWSAQPCKFDMSQT